MINENGISNILVDINFLESEFKNKGRPELMAAFAELRAVGTPSLVGSSHLLSEYAPDYFHRDVR